MFKRYLNKTDGNMSVMFALGSAVLFLGVGISVDVGLSFSARAEMQDVVDNAVLAAATNSQGADYSAFGEKSYQQNISISRLENANVSFRKDDGKIIGTAEGTLPTFFAGVLPKSALDIRVRSVVSISEVSSEPCIIALSPTAQPGDHSQWRYNY